LESGGSRTYRQRGHRLESTRPHDPQPCGARRLPVNPVPGLYGERT